MPNSQYHEKKHHGDARFPFNIYPCTIPWDFPQMRLHWQNSMELLYIKKGRGLVQVGAGADNTVPASVGDIFIFTPGTLHGMRQDAEFVMEYENIIFELSLLIGEDLCTERYLMPMQAGRLALPSLLRPGDSSYSDAAACLTRLEEASRTRTPGYELTVKGTLLEFLGLLLGLQNPLLPSAETSDSRRLKKVLQLISTDYASDLPVARAAEVCGCSASHFMRWFKRMTGQSFTAYLIEHRLCAAADLLRHTDDTMLDIASQTGFDNLSYFNRQFKCHYGMTPSQYRHAE